MNKILTIIITVVILSILFSVPARNNSFSKKDIIKGYHGFNLGCVIDVKGLNKGPFNEWTKDITKNSKYFGRIVFKIAPLTRKLVSISVYGKTGNTLEERETVIQSIVKKLKGKGANIKVDSSHTYIRSKNRRILIHSGGFHYKSKLSKAKNEKRRLRWIENKKNHAIFIEYSDSDMKKIYIQELREFNKMKHLNVYL